MPKYISKITKPLLGILLMPLMYARYFTLLVFAVLYGLYLVLPAAMPELLFSAVFTIFWVLIYNKLLSMGWLEKLTEFVVKILGIKYEIEYRDKSPFWANYFDFEYLVRIKDENSTLLRFHKHDNLIYRIDFVAGMSHYKFKDELRRKVIYLYLFN